ncbi:Bax inhibitor-1/YccA family protein [Streptomyces sp. NPDC001068]
MSSPGSRASRWRCLRSLHFGRIEDGLNRGAPRRQAWAAALGLTLTLV